jgi:hypothetical protein
MYLSEATLCGVSKNYVEEDSDPKPDPLRIWVLGSGFGVPC